MLTEGELCLTHQLDIKYQEDIHKRPIREKLAGTMSLIEILNI